MKNVGGCEMRRKETSLSFGETKKWRGQGVASGKKFKGWVSWKNLWCDNLLGNVKGARAALLSKKEGRASVGRGGGKKGELGIKFKLSRTRGVVGSEKKGFKESG